MYRVATSAEINRLIHKIWIDAYEKGENKIRDIYGDAFIVEDFDLEYMEDGMYFIALMKVIPTNLDVDCHVFCFKVFV